MSVNKHRPHVYVLPEDDANRELANGFQLLLDATRQRQMYVLKVAGGWNEVVHLFVSVHVAEMDRCPTRFMVLLVDFDLRDSRLQDVKEVVPDRLTDRVFILGARGEPEDLTRAGLGSCEIIGKAMANDCREETDKTWGHALLSHNAGEINRLRQHVRPILFSST